MKIKFLKDHKVDAVGGEEYVAGDVVEVNEASASHFTRRGLAQVVADVVTAKASAKKAPAEPDDKAEK